MKNNYRPTKEMMEIREKVFKMVLDKYGNWKEAVDAFAKIKSWNAANAISRLLDETIENTEYYDILINTEPRYHNYNKVLYSLWHEYKKERKEQMQGDKKSSIKKMKQHIKSLNRIITFLAEQDDLTDEEDAYIFDMGTRLDEFEEMVDDYKVFAK